MRTDSIHHSSLADVPPAWVRVALGHCETTRASASKGRVSVQIARGADFTLLTATIADATALPEDALRLDVCEAYDIILSTLDAHRLHAVRFWNFIPSLHAPMGPGIDRYMVFNSGRFLAYSRRASSTDALSRTLPTASGVGSSSSALTIHCFAGPTAGRPIEHARQVPAYRYSFKYGPHPPCFARATLVDVVADARPRLLVGGTASVRGEDSVHVDRLDAQVDETLANLSSIVGAAAAVLANGSGTPAIAGGDGSPDPLVFFTDLRVYLPRPEDDARVTARLAARFPGVGQLEIVRADLCRKELLVEIEGVAAMSRETARRG